MRSIAGARFAAWGFRMTLALASRKRSRLTPGRALRGLQFFLQALDLFPQPRIFPLYTLLVLQRLIPLLTGSA